MDYFARQQAFEQLLRQARAERSRAVGDLIARGFHGAVALVRHGLAAALRRAHLPRTAGAA